MDNARRIRLLEKLAITLDDAPRLGLKDRLPPTGAPAPTVAPAPAPSLGVADRWYEETPAAPASSAQDGFNKITVNRGEGFNSLARRLSAQALKFNPEWKAVSGRQLRDSMEGQMLKPGELNFGMGANPDEKRTRMDMLFSGEKDLDFKSLKLNPAGYDDKQSDRMISAGKNLRAAWARNALAKKQPVAAPSPVQEGQPAQPPPQPPQPQPQPFTMPTGHAYSPGQSFSQEELQRIRGASNYDTNPFRLNPGGQPLNYVGRTAITEEYARQEASRKRAAELAASGMGPR